MHTDNAQETNLILSIDEVYQPPQHDLADEHRMSEPLESGSRRAGN